MHESSHGDKTAPVIGEETKTDRRHALRLAGGGAALAALAAIGFGTPVLAQDATPVPGTSKKGAWIVIRQRVVKPDKSVDDLNAAIGDRLVPIIKAIPGFIDYYVFQNPETRQRASVSIFADKAGTDESTAKAAEFLRSEGLTDYYVDVDPVITEGEIFVAAD